MRILYQFLLLWIFNQFVINAYPISKGFFSFFNNF